MAIPTPLNIGSPIEYFPTSVATVADLAAVSNPRNLAFERVVTENGKTYKYNPVTLEWEASSVSFTQSDAYWQRIVNEILSNVASTLKRRGSFTPTDVLPSTGGSGTDGAVMAGNAWSVTGLATGATVTIDGLELKNGYIVYALVDSPGQTGTNWDVIEAAEMMMPVAHSFVDATRGSDAHGDGTQYYPYATISYCLAQLGTGSTHTVIHLMSNITENLTVTQAYQNKIIYGSPAVSDSQQRVITGNHVFSNAASTRLRFLNVILDGGVGVDDYVLTFNGTAGRHYFENTSIIPDSASSGKAVKFMGANARWHEFYNCYFGGIAECLSTTGTMSIKFTRQLAGEFELNMTNACKVWIYECQRYNQLNHSAGQLLINGLYESWNTSETDAIVSTATAAGSGRLEVLNAKLIDTAGAWKAINKTGDCDYLIDNVTDKSGLHTLTGTRLGTPALRAKDITVETEDWTLSGSAYEMTIPHTDGHEFSVVKHAILSQDDGSGNLTPVAGYHQRKTNGDVYFNQTYPTTGQALILGY